MIKSGEAVLITGATGFVGGAIALELLCTTDADLVCLVRPGRDESAAHRLVKSLQASARMYATDLTDAQIARCTAVVGDVTLPTVGVDTGALANITEIWHAAASLAFDDGRAEEIALHNEQGTRNILELASRISCDTINYISTAYVAGDGRGMIEETPIADSVTPNNHYERTKIAAEQLVQHANIATTRIFRPSIVIGHSTTREATTFNGLYGFVRGLQRARDVVRPSLGDLLKFRPLRLLASRDTPINFIPIDYVTRAAVDIAAKSDESNIYHLANSTPPTLAECWGTVTNVLGMMHPLFVDDPAEFTLIDQKVDNQMEFYRPYLNDKKYFSVSNVEALLGEGVLSYALPADEMAQYVAWYLAYREATKARRELHSLAR